MSTENGDADEATPSSVVVREEEGEESRQGTITSARFNLLSTMVGGGSLSLPLAFHQSGNAFMGPLLLIIVGLCSELSIRSLLAAANARSPPEHSRKGTASFESVTSDAFGPKARYVSMGLVALICFFATVGYAVLLRDLLEPITDALIPPSPDVSPDDTGKPKLAHNLTMLLVMLLVTPLTTLNNLTALEKVGAASMLSVLTLGACVAYRSAQCNFGTANEDIRHSASWEDYMTFVPTSFGQVLDAFPIFISCFMCHYNVIPVHNELQDPTPARVSYLVRSTTWAAMSFYLFIGFTGSMYGNCTPSGTVQGNVLLDFDEDDPLLGVGRLCLAFTVTLAFPMLVIPARDTFLRALSFLRHSPTTPSSNYTQATLDTIHVDSHGSQFRSQSGQVVDPRNIDKDLFEPLLSPEEKQKDEETGTGRTESLVPVSDGVDGDDEMVAVVQMAGVEDAISSRTLRIGSAIVIFWSGAAVACFVKSIDVVWDLLGSSLSIIVGWLIPCGTYIALVSRREGLDDTTPLSLSQKLYNMTAWAIVISFTPLMILCTGNAVYNTFFAP
eukprot:CAMPEP_0198283750 /NCGR_PEP_ID=MMETSP1449-20131203/3340_1 /TAXON_ID=420275 /ORGANISM="Attheya septentrionalis, Strain CCMP2084" /LENGTH=556 /DNA_ID=CAMNT_0043980547 /DNA_START=119 /DNA_END=1789 /DNA_ORIENTATION=-